MHHPFSTWFQVAIVFVLTIWTGTGSFSASAASRRLPGPLISGSGRPISSCTWQNSQNLVEGLSLARNLPFSRHAHPLCQNLEKNLKNSNLKMRDTVHEMHQLHEDIYNFSSNIMEYMQGQYNGNVFMRDLIKKDLQTRKITAEVAEKKFRELEDDYNQAADNVGKLSPVFEKIFKEGSSFDISTIAASVAEGIEQPYRQEISKSLRSMAMAQKNNTYARSRKNIRNFFKNLGAGLKSGCFKKASAAQVQETLLSTAGMLDLVDLQDSLSITLPPANKLPFKHRVPRFQSSVDGTYSQLVSSLFDFDVSSFQSPGSDNKKLVTAIECSLLKVAEECQWSEDIQTTTCFNCTQPASALASESKQVQSIKEALSPKARACKRKEGFFNRLLAQTQQMKARPVSTSEPSPTAQTSPSQAGQ